MPPSFLNAPPLGFFTQQHTESCPSQGRVTMKARNVTLPALKKETAITYQITAGQSGKLSRKAKLFLVGAFFPLKFFTVKIVFSYLQRKECTSSNLGVLPRRPPPPPHPQQSGIAHTVSREAGCGLGRGISSYLAGTGKHGREAKRKAWHPLQAVMGEVACRSGEGKRMGMSSSILC